MNNPYIDGVFYKESADIQYDVVYNLIDTDFVIDPYISAVSQLQRLCNIKNFDDTFEIYTNPHLDYSIKKSIQELKNINELEDDVILVGYQVDWERKVICLQKMNMKKQKVQKMDQDTEVANEIFMI